MENPSDNEDGRSSATQILNKQELDDEHQPSTEEAAVDLSLKPA